MHIHTKQNDTNDYITTIWFTGHQWQGEEGEGKKQSGLGEIYKPIEGISLKLLTVMEYENKNKWKWVNPKEQK
jgi:hypothetical protein